MMINFPFGIEPQNHFQRRIAITFEEKIEMIVSTLREKKAENIRGMDFRNLEGVITDGFIICSAPSERQVGAISEHLRSTLKEQNLTPRSIEGSGLNHWVLIDTGDIVVHIFLDRIREFYRLEQLWGHAPVIALPVSPAGSLSPAEPARG